MSIEARVIELAQAIGADVKAIKDNAGSLTALSTTSKTNLVSAINELKTYADTINNKSGLTINDAATKTNTTNAWSPNKIDSTITTAIAALRTDLTNGASAALDTFKELADALGNDPNFASTIATGLANRVRFDAVQTLTAVQKKQACENIGVGNPDYDFTADYITVKTGA